MNKQFSRYFTIGILNTLVHWGVFLFLHWIILLEQSLSNMGGFIFAVIFSFFMNAKFTFNQATSIERFLGYITFMGGISYLIGKWADKLELPALVTLVSFSGISLVLGFFYSKFIIFKG